MVILQVAHPTQSWLLCDLHVVHDQGSTGASEAVPSLQPSAQNTQLAILKHNINNVA